MKRYEDECMYRCEWCASQCTRMPPGHDGVHYCEKHEHKARGRE